MWFKSAQLYEFYEPFAMDAQTLHDKLTEHAFTPCSRNLLHSEGWTPPLEVDEESPLVFAANGFMMICLKIEEKLLPSRVINQHVADKVAEIEQTYDRKVFRKEKVALKEEIIHTLMPQAFHQSSKLYAYIDPSEGLLVIDTPTASKAEHLCTRLRGALGRLKVQVIPTRSPERLMTQWLDTQDHPEHFLLDDNCVLENSHDTRAVIRARGQDLCSDKLQAFIKEGYFVKELGVQWFNQCRFALKDDLCLVRIQFFDTVKEQVTERFSESEAERFDADFVIMSATLRGLFIDLLGIFRTKEKEDTKQRDAITS